ncbi:hypothetical protein JCM10449v2_006428 [Rhodotorula kratochvilovae]
MPTSAEQARDELLTQLLAVYGWFIQENSDDIHFVDSLKRAQLNFQQEWSELLPLERAEAVDILLAEFSDVAATSGHSYSMHRRTILYRAVIGEIGFSRDAPGARDGQLHQVLVAQLQRCKRPWLALYPADAAAQGHVFDEYYEHFLGAQGLSPEKLARLDESPRNALARVMEGLPDRLRSHEAHHESARGLLPSPDAVLAEAQATAQLPEDCYHIWALLLGHFSALYSHDNLWNEASAVHKGVEAAVMRHVVEEAESTLVRERFEALDAAQRQVEIHKMRKAVFGACKQLIEEKGVPPAWNIEIVYRASSPPPCRAPSGLDRSRPSPGSPRSTPERLTPPRRSRAILPELRDAAQSLAGLYTDGSAGPWQRRFLLDALVAYTHEQEDAISFIETIASRLELGRRLRPVGELPSFAQAVIGGEMQHAAIAPGQPPHRGEHVAHPIVLHSLAHPRQAISDRKARRYYGTSAAAWANGRQAFGRW